MNPKLVLVTGASGYIGGKLIPLLLERGYRVRCLVRDPSRLAGRAWAGQVEVLAGDLATAEGLAGALHGAWTAYYLVHNMSSGRHYPERDLAAARNLAAAAAAAGVEHIIYLGGLADPQERISPHMRSRIETGEALRQGPVPVTEFRAGVIIGPGSISFEMIRYLAEQFPLLIGPPWLKNRAQPVAAASVFDYLLAALGQGQRRGRVYEIGGDEVLSYAGIMLAYARLRGLRRGLVTLPGIPLWLMAFFVEKLTPVPKSIARPLIEGLQADSLVRDDSARRAFPGVRPLPLHEALTDALAKLHPAHLELSPDGRPVQSLKQDGFCLDVRRVRLEVPPEAAYRAFSALGGPNGWFYANWLWRVRGLLDRLAGGPGMRGRPGVLAEGAVLDFYRVEVLEPGRRLRLRAELKSPGTGWMEWTAAEAPGGCLLTQAASFAPSGLSGFLYWTLLGPIHRLVFAGLLKRIAQRAVTIYNRVEEEGNDEN